MLYGSMYIYLEFQTQNFKQNLPRYILDSIPANEISINSYQLPTYLMIKFRGQDSDIDKCYEILQIALKAKEWNVIFK